MDMKIIDPIPVEALEAELTADKFLRHTNKGGNHIYIVDAYDSPNVMREIGRLREIAFRTAGGGTGKDCDIDEFDTMQPPCRQLIVWNPEAREIIGGYRFITGENIHVDNGRPRIATSHMFSFSTKFLEEYLPYTLELGRSFVALEYQSTRVGTKALYALDNLWDGLGALTVKYPSIKYLFGKVTMYPSYNADCRNMILYFLNKHFPDNEGLVKPFKPLDTHMNLQERLQDTQQGDTRPRIQHPASRQRLHEPVAFYEDVWHRDQRRVWRCRGNRNILCHIRHL